MNNKEDYIKTIITDKKNTQFYFLRIMYWSTINQIDKVILQTIHKNKPNTMFLITVLKMWGWKMDEMVEPNPSEEKKEGEEWKTLTVYNYHLVLDPIIKTIQQDVLRDKKAKEIMIYLLDISDLDRKKTDEIMEELSKNKEIMKVLSSLVDYVIKKIKEK